MAGYGLEPVRQSNGGTIRANNFSDGNGYRIAATAPVVEEEAAEEPAEEAVEESEPVVEEEAAEEGAQAEGEAKDAGEGEASE